MTIPPYVIQLIIQAATAIILQVLQANSLTADRKPSSSHAPLYAMPTYHGTNVPLTFQLTPTNRDRIRICFEIDDAMLVYDVMYSNMVQDLENLQQWVLNVLADLFNEFGHQRNTVQDPGPIEAMTLQMIDATQKAYADLHNPGLLECFDKHHPTMGGIFPPSDSLTAETIHSLILINRNLNERIERLENEIVHIHTIGYEHQQITNQLKDKVEDLDVQVDANTEDIELLNL